jgi:hypothetical protein
VDDNTEKFLNEHFKAGEYSVVKLMVKNSEIGRLIEILKTSKLNMVVMPEAQAKIDFADDTKKGTEQ